MIINSGMLLNKRLDQYEPYYMTMVNKQSIHHVMKLQNLVYSALPNKDLLVTDTYNELCQGLESGGFIVGVYSLDHELISYRYISLPTSNESNMGFDIHLPHNELHRVAHLETTVVHPHFRGNDLQNLTLQNAYPILTEKSIRHLICTVSPFNIFSLRNILKNGLKIKTLKRKYSHIENNPDGLWRFILHKNIELPKPQVYKKNISLELLNLETASKFLDSGFIGHSLSANCQTLVFSK